MTEKLKGLLAALFLFLITACAGTPPLLEQAKAVEAQKYAQKNYSSKYASSSYRKGGAYLRKAHDYFEKRLYPKAKEAYDYARRYFEHAETKSRVEQIKSGGGF